MDHVGHHDFIPSVSLLKVAPVSLSSKIPRNKQNGEKPSKMGEKNKKKKKKKKEEKKKKNNGSRRDAEALRPSQTSCTMKLASAGVTSVRHTRPPRLSSSRLKLSWAQLPPNKAEENPKRKRKKHGGTVPGKNQKAKAGER